MTYNELLDTLPEEDRKTIQAEFDRKVSAGIKKYAENHTVNSNVEDRLKSLYNKINLIERERNNLRTYAIQESYKHGVDYSLLETYLPVCTSKDLIDTQIKSLQNYKAQVSQKTQADFIAQNAYKPSGGRASETKDLGNYSVGELAALEESGQLDKML